MEVVSAEGELRSSTAEESGEELTVASVNSAAGTVEIVPNPLAPAVEEAAGSDVGAASEALEPQPALVEEKGLEPAPSRPINFAAWASLVLGAMVIVPFLTGIAALMLGVFGLRACNLHQASGRKLVKAGMILGMVNLAGWSCFFGFVSLVGGAERSLAKRFVDELAEGKSAAAARECSAKFGKTELDGLTQKLNGWGGVRSVEVDHISRASEGLVTTGKVDGVLWTGDGKHRFEVTMVNAHERWWVEGAEWE